MPAVVPAKAPAMTYYVCSLPQPGEPGEPKELFTDDLALAERFIEAEDKRPDRGVYQCLNPLVPGARRRSLETVSRLQYIYLISTCRTSRPATTTLSNGCAACGRVYLGT